MKKIDKSNMRKIILDFPKQFRVGFESAKNVKVPGNFDKVLICGMGGSALPADILKMWLSAYKIALPLEVRRNYGLPHRIDNKYLIICISYSGNTEETLYAFKEALRKKLPLAAITTGGKLAKLCQKYKIPSAVIPAGFQPRMALGFQFTALMKILSNCKIVENNLEDIPTLEKNLEPKKLENQGKKLAKKLKNKIPIIYTSDKLKSLARIWKIKFNENSKTPAFYNYFPELNHNEMIGYEGQPALNTNQRVIILRDPADYPRNLKRMKLTAEILKKKGVGVDIVELKGKDILYKIFSNILLGDWASYYLALEYGIDPTPVKINEEFKKKMKGRM